MTLGTSGCRLSLARSTRLDLTGKNPQQLEWVTAKSPPSHVGPCHRLPPDHTPFLGPPAARDDADRRSLHPAALPAPPSLCPVPTLFRSTRAGGRGPRPLACTLASVLLGWMWLDQVPTGWPAGRWSGHWAPLSGGLDAGRAVGFHEGRGQQEQDWHLSPLWPPASPRDFSPGHTPATGHPPYCRAARVFTRPGLGPQPPTHRPVASLLPKGPRSPSRHSTGRGQPGPGPPLCATQASAASPSCSITVPSAGPSPSATAEPSSFSHHKNRNGNGARLHPLSPAAPPRLPSQVPRSPRTCPTTTPSTLTWSPVASTCQVAWWTPPAL